MMVLSHESLRRGLPEWILLVAIIIQIVSILHTGVGDEERDGHDVEAVA